MSIKIQPIFLGLIGQPGQEFGSKTEIPTAIVRAVLVPTIDCASCAAGGGG